MLNTTCWEAVKCDVRRNIADVTYQQSIENCWDEGGVTVPDVTYLKNTVCNM